MPMAVEAQHSGLSSRVVASRAAVTVAASMLLYTMGPPSIAWQLIALLVAMATTGLSHGAVDHLVASRCFRVQGVWFYLPYLAVSAVTAMIWLGSPPLALAVFLAISVWHFGEGDLRDHAPNLERRAMASLTRGLIVVGVLFTAWPDEVAGLLGPDLWRMPAFERTPWIPLVLCGAHVLSLVVSTRRWRASLELAVYDALVLALWLWVAPPILAFAGYFAVWHSMAHIDTLQT
ncbi:MAG: hypothetical protein CL927_09185, partial [Deltaproteobacteria bacterium]|nr:hypothetical protein [Deltaproteobacteria bacterium]